ncbi:hypothetical protein Tco_1380348 [Tanacetum coccineum]
MTVVWVADDDVRVGGDDEDSGGSGALVVGGDDDVRRCGDGSDDVGGYDGMMRRYGEGGVVEVVSWGWR